MSAGLVDICALDRARPAVDAPATAVAGWYARKARVLSGLAAASRDAGRLDEAALYTAWATAAGQHSNPEGMA